MIVRWGLGELPAVLGEGGALRDGLLEKLYRDVRVIDIVEGTQQVQRVVVARRLVELPSE